MKFLKSIIQFFQDGMKIVITLVSMTVFGLVRYSFKQNPTEIKDIVGDISIVSYIFATGAIACVFIIGAAMIVSWPMTGFERTESTENEFVVALATFTITSIVFWLIKIGFV